MTEEVASGEAEYTEALKIIRSKKHVGEYEGRGHMLDGWKCSCGWRSAPYFDGAEYAKNEWEAHVKAQTKRRALI